LAEHVAWMREHKYNPLCVLPHDGASNDKVFAVSYESALRQAGFEVRVIPNVGAGAASTRIEAVRRVFPNIWFNEATTSGGREALGWYHEKRDATRSIGLGPEHDWASHAADAFGMMAMDYEQAMASPAGRGPIQYRRLHH
jgi:phage terminase large subunit